MWKKMTLSLCLTLSFSLAHAHGIIIVSPEIPGNDFPVIAVQDLGNRVQFRLHACPTSINSQRLKPTNIADVNANVREECKVQSALGIINKDTLIHEAAIQKIEYVGLNTAKYGAPVLEVLGAALGAFTLGRVAYVANQGYSIYMSTIGVTGSVGAIFGVGIGFSAWGIGKVGTEELSTPTSNTKFLVENLESIKDVNSLKPTILVWNGSSVNFVETYNKLMSDYFLK